MTPPLAKLAQDGANGGQLTKWDAKVKQMAGLLTGIGIPWWSIPANWIAAAPARSPTRPPIEDTLWVAGWGSGPVSQFSAAESD
jgi:hypothetical protein